MQLPIPYGTMKDTIYMNVITLECEMLMQKYQIKYQMLESKTDVYLKYDQILCSIYHEC